jgi:NodT family efflux transporter outer membrane factor (OMF) lipoprotein
MIQSEALAQWWNTLNDPVLTQLIQHAVVNSPDIKDAQARVRQSRAQLGISAAGLFPMLDTSGSYTRNLNSENMPKWIESTDEANIYHAGFDATWEIDIFGGVRRGVEAAKADLQSQTEGLNNIWVTLAGEIAQNYIMLRTFQQRLIVVQANLDTQTKTLELVESLYRSGLRNELAVHQARYMMETTRSLIPTLKSNIEAFRNTLCLLTGQIPGELDDLISKAKPIPVPTIKTVVGIPAETLRNRPDIRQAERALAAQTARIGQATADLYPKFRLFGSIGLESLESNTWFESPSQMHNLGGVVSWPIFHGGSIRENIKVQEAIQEQMLARYEKTVLVSVKEVRDALMAYAQEQKSYEALVQAVKSAQAALDISQDQYKNGLIDFNNVLDAQRSVLALQESLVMSEGTISADFVRIYKALGGGWQSMALMDAPKGWDKVLSQNK